MGWDAGGGLRECGGARGGGSGPPGSPLAPSRGSEGCGVVGIRVWGVPRPLPSLVRGWSPIQPPDVGRREAGSTRDRQREAEGRGGGPQPVRVSSGVFRCLLDAPSSVLPPYSPLSPIARGAILFFSLTEGGEVLPRVHPTLLPCTGHL